MRNRERERRAQRKRREQEIRLQMFVLAVGAALLLFLVIFGIGRWREALAEKADLTTQFVSYAESGKRAMRPENLLKLSIALEVSADYLLTGDVVDKDLLLLSKKLSSLNSEQLRLIEKLLDDCMEYFN
ncbi:MAG: helix-turn-helix transcriptional regulator [Acidaminococcaceae bacterium]|nr:helix-turn-helix transcriptional regulator [Acidaminococcaceae bacterium]